MGEAKAHEGVAGSYNRVVVRQYQFSEHIQGLALPLLIPFVFFVDVIIHNFTERNIHPMVHKTRAQLSRATNTRIHKDTAATSPNKSTLDTHALA